MYYGNSSATDAQSATSVWDSNYKLIQHLKETSGTTTSDSTSNSNNGTKLSATEPNPTTSGKIDGAQTFDGSNDKISTSTLIVSDNFTLEAWVKKAASLTNNGACSSDQWYCGFGIIDSEVSGAVNDYGLSVKDNKAIFGVGNPDTSILGTTTLSTGTWYYITATRNQTSGRIEIYVNGSLENNVNATNTNSLNANTKDLIGNSGDATGRSFNGDIDEVRISNTVRSSAWIAATYKTQNDTFNTFASEEPRIATSGTLTSSIFDTEISAGAAWGTLTYSATTPSNTSVSVKVRTSNSSSMAGATAFGSCTAISSGSDISSNTCVTDSHRYVQYLLTLANTDSTSTPTFTSFSLAFASYDADAPSISLTALTPDPNSDNTPTLSGTATDTIGTVSNVQFQMDSTSGSWSSCTASDGSFNSASEAFSCTAATLTDGSHTMYVRATDSNGNTTSSSYASDSFTIDATNPVSIDLDSPGNNSYTNNERPTFKWKTTTDATAGLSKYVLEIDNPSIGSSQPSGDFTIDNIPTSGTTDITSNNKYVIHFENFNDSDSTNNYISVYTKSSSDWSSSENDGKLREGRVSWKVKAVDNASNETSSSRTLFVDKTKPLTEFTKVNSVVIASGSEAISGISTTDTTPTIFGKITDSLAGGDSSKTQDEYGPRVASGLGKAEVKVEKKQGLGYKLLTLYTVNFDKPKYSCDDKELSDNTKQKCDKYSTFEYIPKESLELGIYRITLTGRDKADNTIDTSFTLNISTLSQITTEEERAAIEEEVKKLPQEEREKVKEELEVTKPFEAPSPNIIEKASGTVANVVKQSLTSIGNGIASSVNLLAMTIKDGTTFVFDKTGQGVGNGLLAMTNTIGTGYNNLANNAPGVTKNILLAVGNGVSTVGTGIGNGFSAVGTGINATSHVIASEAKQSYEIATGYALAMTKATQNGTANIAFAIGEKTDDVSHEFGTAIIKIGYLFVPEPTKISDVNAVALSPTATKITWTTNHPANGKVNWGYEDGVYGFEDQTDKRTSQHEFILTNLKPDTEYHYEVMSQNRNYVYDANRKFKTPAVTVTSR